MIIHNNLNSVLKPFAKYYFNHPILIFSITIFAFILLLVFCFIFARSKYIGAGKKLGMTFSVLLLFTSLTTALVGAWNEPSPIIYQKSTHSFLPIHAVYDLVPGLKHSNVQLQNQKQGGLYGTKYVLTSNGLVLVNLTYEDFDTIKLQPVNTQGKALVSVINALTQYKDHKDISVSAGIDKAVGYCHHNHELIRITVLSQKPSSVSIKTIKKN